MAGTRELRIDFFRGLALIVIFIDHMPGNHLGRLTPRNFGFSDAADAFVLLCGISTVIAYFPAAQNSKLGPSLKLLARRMVKFYAANVAVLWVAMALLLAASHVYNRSEFMGWAIPE